MSDGARLIYVIEGFQFVFSIIGFIVTISMFRSNRESKYYEENPRYEAISKTKPNEEYMKFVDYYATAWSYNSKHGYEAFPIS